MSFQNFINQAWADHSEKSEEVMQKYNHGVVLSTSEAELLALARLVIHIATEHNFNFLKGVEALEVILKNSLITSEEAIDQIRRHILTLNYIQDSKMNISQCSISDRSSIFISTASVSLYRQQIDHAKKYLTNAISASYSLQNDDRAFRILAMQCNNMAAFLSEKKERTEVEKTLMIDLAHYSRGFWEKAGTWLETERAEYFLSRYYRINNQFKLSLKHAQLCLDICKIQKDEYFELFFAHEALALVYRELNNEELLLRHRLEMKKYFDVSKAKDQAVMQETLQTFES